MDVIKSQQIIQKLQRKQINIDNYGISWRFHPEGILSENIFGSFVDYTCACGIPQEKDYICPVCGVKSESSYTRYNRFGTIELNTNVVNPLIYIISNSPNFINAKQNIYIDLDQIVIHKQPFQYGILLYDHLILIRVMQNLGIDIDLPEKDKLFFYEHLNYFDSVATKITDNLLSNQNINKKALYKLLTEYNIDFILPDKIKVLPAGYRLHVVRSVEKQLTVYSNIFNKLYNKIVSIANKIKDYDTGNTVHSYLYVNLKATLNELYVTLLHYLTKKKGLYRRYLMGRNSDLSFRGVLVGDPFLRPDTLRIPYYGFIMIAYPDLLKRLPYNIKKNMDILDEALESYNIPDIVKEVSNDIIKKEKVNVLLMRQPVLHLPSTQLFRIVDLQDDLSIAMNQLLWSGYNADSDGDTVVLWRVFTDKDVENFHPSKHILTPRQTINLAIEYDSLAGYVI